MTPESEIPPEIPAIEPGQFAALVREATDEQLRAGLEANRELILGEIFRRMPEHLNTQRATGVDATVEWRIRQRGIADSDAWHLVIRDSRCDVRAGPAEAPTVTYEIEDLDFIRLITGSASGPRLFLYGRLKIRGNLLLGARMPLLFKIPGEPEA